MEAHDKYSLSIECYSNWLMVVCHGSNYRPLYNLMNQKIRENFTVPRFSAGSVREFQAMSAEWSALTIRS